MKNRKPETGNRKPINVAHVHGARVSRFTFPVCGFLFSILLSFAAIGPIAALAAPPKTPGAAPAPHVPTGFGKAKFGMTLEQVRPLYPTLAPAPQMTGAAYFRSPQLARYLVTKVRVPGLQEPCTLELRFWKNQLWSAIIHYGTNKFSDVEAILRKEYGPLTSKTGAPTWTFDTATVVTSPGQLWYSFDDNGIGKDVQGALVEAVHQQQQKQKAPAPAPVK